MEKLFYKDIHITDFSGTVEECTPDGRGHFLVLLDQTAFFPEEGGQVADSGTLNGQKVVDVRIKEDNIYHVVEEEIPKGHTVQGHVNWKQRFDFMQQHSGEHIVSGLVHQHYGYNNVGFHLGLTEVTLDFNGSLTLTQLREIEEEANQVIWSNLLVQISFPPRELLDSMQYRSKIELKGPVRIVEIPGVDVCACCAPHVEYTGQIGLLKITGVQSHRGGVRVNILCGGRALQDYTLRQDSVTDISKLLSSKPEHVAQAVERLKEESRIRKERGNELQERLLNMEMQALPAPSETKHVALFVQSLDAIAMRNAVNKLCGTYKGYCGLFAGDDKNGYHFVIGSNNLDCRTLAGSLREAFGAKGGGSAPMIQGSLTAPADKIRVLFMNA